MILLQRTVYCVGLLLWLSYVTLCPTWIGRIYGPGDPSDPGKLRYGGVFALQGTKEVRKRAPIWNPPRASKPASAPSVRWPWQRPSRGQHVELALGRMASRLSVGLLVLGLVVRGISWVGHPKQPDLLVSVAWSISLSLVLAWCCILVIIAGTAGYGATEGVISKVLVVGMAVGLFYGITAYESSVHGSSKVGTVPARLSGQVDVSKIGSGLFWFTIGIVFAGCVTMAGGWLASFFRGPKAGITGFGTTRYARDQTCVDIVAGLGILAVGWILGIALLRFRTRRALSIGLIAGTTILGILFAF